MGALCRIILPSSSCSNAAALASPPLLPAAGGGPNRPSRCRRLDLYLSLLSAEAASLLSPSTASAPAAAKRAPAPGVAARALSPPGVAARTVGGGGVVGVVVAEEVG